MPFTEFYTDFTNGSNVNAGDKTANGVVTSTNGAWSTVTNIFTATSGTPFSGVSVGDFCSLYADGGTVSVYIARITAIGGGGLTLTLSTTAKSGTAPTTAGIGISATTGGAWKGPNGAVAFPFGFITSALTNASSHAPRVNLKNNVTYSVTAAMTHGNAGPMQFQGYTTTVDDGGRATIDGGSSGASYSPLTISSSDNVLADLILQNNGATGTASWLTLSGSRGICFRVVVNGSKAAGFLAGGLSWLFVECEAYGCNTSNSGGVAGFHSSAAFQRFVRCISHDNTAGNSLGFTNNSGGEYDECIADSNGAQGFVNSGTVQAGYRGCDAYNNGSDGIRLSNGSAGMFLIENCNLVKNGGYGINGSGAGVRTGIITNCGFGSGTQVNTSGATNGLSSMIEIGSITYASNVTPWVDPANGDFRINLGAAKGTGRGAFTQTAASYAGTVGYPDIGSAQHLESSGGITVPTQVYGTESVGVGS